jgi:hypothetical protein
MPYVQQKRKQQGLQINLEQTFECRNEMIHQLHEEHFYLETLIVFQLAFYKPKQPLLPYPETYKLN